MPKYPALDDWKLYRCYGVWWDDLTGYLEITTEEQAIDCKARCEDCVFYHVPYR